MDRLELIFASREFLERCGLSPRKRRLTSLRLQKLKEFQDLVTDQPHVYGGFGSDRWIRGLLTQLNEPGVVAWDDVVEWLSKSDVAELLEKASKVPPTGRFKEPVNASHSPMLKHAIVRIERCAQAEEMLKRRKLEKMKPVEIPNEIDALKDSDKMEVEEELESQRQTLGDAEEVKVQDGGGDAFIENDIMDNLEYNDVSASELAEAVDEYFQDVLKDMEQGTLDEDLQKDLMSVIVELS